MLDPFGLEMLERAQCLALLGTARIGRVVFTNRGLPAVQPVKFTLDKETVYFTAPADSTLFAATHDSVVAFEADVFADDLSAGWCVTVLGRANEDREGGVSGCLSWRREPAGERRVRLPVEVVDGRRLPDFAH